MENYKQVLKVLLSIITLCLIGCSTNNKKDAGTGHIRNDSTHNNFSQNLPKDYKIDGSVSYFEIRDTISFKKVLKTENLVIKENDSLFYIGIYSNTLTIANLYAISSNKIKIMHASGAIGEVNFHKENDYWKKNTSEWIWRHRDLSIWDELHPKPLQDMHSFFKEFNWFANTVSKGSFREWEFIVSKKIAPKVEMLGITFLVKKEKIALVNEPSWFNGITNNYGTNVKIHMGDIPETLNINNEKL